MLNETFTSGGMPYKITVYAAPPDGKKHPVVVLLHGNFGMGAPYGDQIRSFAKDLAGLGYLTAVPQYYQDDNPHPDDTVPHVQMLADAILALAKRPEADIDRLGLIGFSLGSATSMTFIASSPPGAVKVFADFFGFLTPTIRAGVPKFPPTIILHDKNDLIVPVANSQDLDRHLPATVDHLLVPPYDELWQGANHAFKPGGAVDIDSRSKTTDWFIKHVPPVGK